MATVVSVTESYANPDYFQGKNTPVYPYGAISSTPGDSLVWAGSVMNAIGTYVDPNTIAAEEQLTFGAGVLQIGDIATPSTIIFGAADYTIMLGSNEVGEYGGIELIGNQTSNASVGALTFHNEAAVQADKIIAEISGERYGDDDAGALFFRTSDTDGNLEAGYTLANTTHIWYIADDNKVQLESSAFTLTNVPLTFNDTDTQIWEDGSANLSFKDANAGTLTLSDISDGLNSWGLVDQIPHMNSGPDDFDYSSDLSFASSILSVGGSAATSQLTLNNTATYNWWMKSTADTNLTLGYYTATYLTIDSSGIMLTGTIDFNDTLTQIWEDGSDNLSFKDANYGTMTLSEIVTRAEWDQNGFDDVEHIDLSWDDGSRTLTITPTSFGAFTYYIAGIAYEAAGAITETITDTEGMWVFYLDSEGSITSVNNPSHAQIDTVIENYAIIAYVYWDATNNDGRLMTELHGMNMSPATHHWIHDNVGSSYKDGMALADFSIGGGDDNADAQFSVATGEFYDEDLEHVLSAVGSTAGLEIWYLDSTDWRWDTNAGYSVRTFAGGSGRLAYNNAGAQTEVSNGYYVLCHVYATNIVSDGGISPKFIAIQGQYQYQTLSQARDGADTEINELTYGTLPLEELIPVATVIFRTQTPQMSNAVHAAVIPTAAGDNYVDWRSSNLKATGGSVSDHGALAGLADDDHSQYALLTGRTSDILLIDTLNEFTTDAGITAEGVSLKDTIVTADAFYIESSATSITIDSTGAMIFEDAIGGPYELSELASSGAGVTFGAEDQIPVTNAATTDFDYSAGLTYDGSIFYISGAVGIGTTSPDYDLEIENAGNAIMQLRAGTGSLSAVYFGDTVGSGRGRVTYDHGQDSMDFYTSAAERMTIDSSGNVGIGTIAPGATLEVVGGIRAATLTSGTTGDYIMTWDNATGELVYDPALSITGDGVRLNNAGGQFAFGSDSSSYIKDTGGDMLFTDDSNTDVTLSSLVAAGSGDVTAVGTLTDNYLIVGAGGTSISVADNIINVNEQILFNTGDVEPGTDDTHALGATTKYWSAAYIRELYLDDTANYRLYVSGTDTIIETGGSTSLQLGTSLNYTARDWLPSGTTKTLDLGGTSNYWDNAYVDRLYIDVVGTYIDVNGADMTLTSVTAGTVNLADLAAGASYWDRTGTLLSPTTSGDDITYDGIFYEPVINYTGVISSSPETPVAGIKFINIEQMTGALYDLYIDLDNLEYADYDSFVFISYEWSNTTQDIYIRNAANETMRTVTAAPAIQEGGWTFHWDHSNGRWNSVVMTSH